MRVPNVSKISTNRNANTTTIKFAMPISEKSALNTAPNVSPNDAKSQPAEKFGNKEYQPASGFGT